MRDTSGSIKVNVDECVCVPVNVNKYKLGGIVELKQQKNKNISLLY